MKPKTLVLMVIAVGCGLVASFMTSRYLAAGQNQAPVQEETVSALVPKRKLTQFTLVTDAEAFEAKEFRKKDLNKDVILDFEKVKGRRLKNALTEGKWFGESDLIDPEHVEIDYKLQPGEVAMTIKVTQEGAGGGFIKPGSRVDVIGTLTRTSKAAEQPFSKTILQNIEVLATNALMTAPENVTNTAIDRVTLRLLRKQAEQVAVFSETGKLTLVQRRTDDTKIEETGGGQEARGARSNSADESAGPGTEQPGAVPLQSPTVPDNAKPEVTPEEAKKNSKLTVIGATSKTKEHEFPPDGTDKNKAPTEKKQP